MLSSQNHSNHHYKASFDQDFILSKPTLPEVVTRLSQWRDKLEPLVKKVPKSLHLENFSRYLVEFEHQKYDEVEVPGQYLLVRDEIF
jgi:transformation/transcription domain-associated protein